MKLYLVAGEASGDLHGSNLIRGFKQLDTELEFRGWGGERMASAGMDLQKHYSELAFMGFAEVIANLGTILKNFKTIKADITAYQPDVLILIDYPGFNLRLAKWAHEQGIRVFYYISPQLWAWKAGRVKQIKRSVERLYAILPFEAAWYAKHDLEIEYHGHPLLDAISSLGQTELSLESDKPILAILPGSRHQEIKRMLPIFLESAKSFPQFKPVVAGLSQIGVDTYASFGLKEGENLLIDQTYPLLKIAERALVTSGTASLETALFGVAQVVAYKGGWISYQIGKRLIQVDHIAMPNLILNKTAVPELIQNEANPKQIASALAAFDQPDRMQAFISDMKQLNEVLGGSGSSERTARSILDRLRRND